MCAIVRTCSEIFVVLCCADSATSKLDHFFNAYDDIDLVRSDTAKCTVKKRGECKQMWWICQWNANVIWPFKLEIFTIAFCTHLELEFPRKKVKTSKHSRRTIYDLVRWYSRLEFQTERALFKFSFIFSPNNDFVFCTHHTNSFSFEFRYILNGRCWFLCTKMCGSLAFIFA